MMINFYVNYSCALLLILSGTPLIIACQGGSFAGAMVRSSNPKKATDATIAKADRASMFQQLKRDMIITSEELQQHISWLQSPEGKAVFAEEQSKTMDTKLDELFANLTNEPVERLGYTFEGLHDYFYENEAALRQFATRFASYGEYLAKFGVALPQDISLEGIKRQLANADKFFNPAMLTSSNRKSVDAFFVGFSLQRPSTITQAGQSGCEGYKILSSQGGASANSKYSMLAAASGEVAGPQSSSFDQLDEQDDGSTGSSDEESGEEAASDSVDQAGPESSGAEDATASAESLAPGCRAQPVHHR